MGGRFWGEVGDRFRITRVSEGRCIRRSMLSGNIPGDFAVLGVTIREAPGAGGGAFLRRLRFVDRRIGTVRGKGRQVGF